MCGRIIRIIIIVKKKRRIHRDDVIINKIIIIRNGVKTISLSNFVWET